LVVQVSFFTTNLNRTGLKTMDRHHCKNLPVDDWYLSKTGLLVELVLDAERQY
jgi:hypothetical protein